MSVISIPTAAAELADLLARVEAGDEVVLTRDGRPVARLVSVRPSADAPVLKRRFGALRGRVTVGPAFFEPLPDEELALWA